MFKMPGYIIHLAVGREYMKKNKIDDVKSFEKGIIAPDLKKDKRISHYGPNSSHPNLNRFVQENSNFDSYTEGYFLHLATDHLFYNRFLKTWNKSIYEDYNLLNANLIKKYGIIIPSEIESIVRFKEGNLHILNEDEICGFINAVGKIDFRKIIYQKNNVQSKIEEEL